MVAKRRGWLAFGLGAAAVAWAAVLVPAAFVAPAYTGVECGTNGCVTSSATFFAVNGWWAIEFLIGILFVSAISLLALHARCATGSRLGTTVAAAGITALLVFTFLTGLSIGLFVFPTVVLLIASAAVTPLLEPPRAA